MAEIGGVGFYVEETPSFFSCSRSYDLSHVGEWLPGEDVVFDLGQISTTVGCLVGAEDFRVPEVAGHFTCHGSDTCDGSGALAG